MADQEVIKHTKKVYKIWSNKEHGLWSKIKEFLIEICIIVFAVTLSIWLHDRSEHAHQQQVVKQFLTGLRSDLENDIKEMKTDKENYRQSQAAFKYVLNSAKSKTMDQDSLKRHQGGIFISVQFVPNDGRYEGFKSSGNIGNIENAALQNDIVDFYQENIKTLVLTNNYYSARKEKFFDYFINNIKRSNDSTISTNISSLLMSDVSQSYSMTLVGLDEVLARYDSCINKAGKIISEINKEYH